MSIVQLPLWRTPLPPAPRPAHLPLSPSETQVWIDFDGTITRSDVLDELIAAFAIDDGWKQVEARWQAGEIGSYECLRDEFAALRVDAPTLERFLETIPVDPGAAALFSMLRTRGVPFTILSDGVESFIRIILERIGAGLVKTRSNRIAHDGDRVTLLCPHRHPACDSHAAHCKCRSAELLGDFNRASIYIGDGRSDICPARKADVVFAKGVLARILKSEGRPYYPFDTLHDVAAVLNQAWSTA